ncbi:CBS domain-containing protein [Amycolatopsis pigmentata]|uniref:CBS domain-containing protein n=1 Tax=Amycolatopsis pigmentata TaxID=450801 RepID=A0ABW5FQH4_9PSEU
MYAREIMSRPAVRVGPNSTVREATALLLQHGFAALPVVNSDEQVVGIFTEADALRGGVAADSAELDRPVEEVMTSPVEVVTLNTEIAQIARHMLSDRLRCVPVVQEGALVGVISRRDLLRPLVRHDDAIAAELRALLRDYSGQRDRWTVEVVGGIATISGEFSDEAERRVVDALTKTVPGVTRAELVQVVRSSR